MCVHNPQSRSYLLYRLYIPHTHLPLYQLSPRHLDMGLAGLQPLKQELYMLEQVQLEQVGLEQVGQYMEQQMIPLAPPQDTFYQDPCIYSVGYMD